MNRDQDVTKEHLMRWFRMYTEILDDPKIGTLTDSQMATWVKLLALAARNSGSVPTPAAVAFALRRNRPRVEKLIGELIEIGLLEKTDDNGQVIVKPHNWHKRQYQSDVSTERVREFRKRKGNVSSPLPKPPQSLQNTDIQKSLSVSPTHTNGKQKVKEEFGSDFMARVMGLFEAANGSYPEAHSLAAQCRETGCSESTVISVITDGLAKRPDVTTWKYFWPKILQAHGAIEEGKTAIKQASSVVKFGRPELPSLEDQEKHIIFFKQHRNSPEAWPRNFPNPPHPTRRTGCPFDAELLRKHGYAA